MIGKIWYNFISFTMGVAANAEHSAFAAVGADRLRPVVPAKVHGEGVWHFGLWVVICYVARCCVFY